MSQLVVEVCQIDEVKPHPNADRLDIAVIKGWQCVVRKDQHKPGDKVVYFPPDTMIPQHWANQFGVWQYLQYKEKDPQFLLERFDNGVSSPELYGRIRCAKLRGEPSFGLVVDPALPGWEVGDDVHWFYLAKKYEPPVKLGAGDAETDHPLFVQYTDIENLRNFPEVLLEGEEVVVTEKIHGSNCRIGIVFDAATHQMVVMAGSHRLRRKEPLAHHHSLYWLPRQHPALASLFATQKAWFDSGNIMYPVVKQLIIFAEVYGNGVQRLQYDAHDKPAFRVFDVLLDGRYFDWDTLCHFCQNNDLPIVPVLYVGPYHLDIIKKLSQGKSMLANHIKEGVVIKPLKERHDPKVGRVILKYIGDQYLLGLKDDDDSTDI